MITFIKTITATLYKIYKYGIPAYILSFGDSLGDNLLLTVLAKELYEKGHKNIWIKCDRQALFEHNPYVKLVMPYQTLLSGTILNAFKVQTAYPRYTVYHQETDSDEMPDKHIMLKMADAVNLKGAIANKPVIKLNEHEKLKGKLAKDQIVISTSSTGAQFPMTNKEWDIEKYQQIVNTFSNAYTFIQLGSAADAPLEGVMDMRGKTSLRESAAILSNSALMISHVGFLMHLARAVDCRSVIIYGGREKPEQSGYTCFENLYSAVECSPCWLHNKCDHDKKCMRLITADMAENTILRQLRLTDKPLTVDILYND